MNGANQQHREACWVHCRGKTFFFAGIKSSSQNASLTLTVCFLLPLLRVLIKLLLLFGQLLYPCVFSHPKLHFSMLPVYCQAVKKICKEFLRLDSICAHLGRGAGRFCCVHHRGRMILGTAGVLVSQAGHLTKLSHCVRGHLFRIIVVGSQRSPSKTEVLGLRWWSLTFLSQGHKVLACDLGGAQQYRPSAKLMATLSALAMQSWGFTKGLSCINVATEINKKSFFAVLTVKAGYLHLQTISLHLIQSGCTWSGICLLPSCGNGVQFLAQLACLLLLCCDNKRARFCVYSVNLISGSWQNTCSHSEVTFFLFDPCESSPGTLMLPLNVFLKSHTLCKACLESICTTQHSLSPAVIFFPHKH